MINIVKVIQLLLLLYPREPEQSLENLPDEADRDNDPTSDVRHL